MLSDSSKKAQYDRFGMAGAQAGTGAGAGRHHGAGFQGNTLLFCAVKLNDHDHCVWVGGCVCEREREREQRA